MAVGKTSALTNTDRSQYAQYVSQVRAALASQKDARVQKAVNALGSHLIKLESQGKDVSKLLAKKDADVIETVRGRGFKGLPDRFTASLARFAKSGAHKDKLTDRTDHSADIKKKVDAKIPSKNKADQAFEAMQNSPEVTAFYTALASAAGPALAEGLKPLVALQQQTNPKAAADFEKLVASQKSVEEKVAGFRQNPLTRDGVALLLSQFAAISKPTREAIRAIAKKSGRKFTDVCEGLRNEMIVALHKAQAGVSAEAQKAFSVDESSAAFQALPPEQQAQVRAHGAKIKAVMEKLAKDPKSLTDEDKKILATTDMTPDEISAAATGATSTTNDTAQLHELPPELRQAVENMNQAREDYANLASSNLSEILGLIDSGLPIEIIVMLVMVKLTEKHERKLQVKLKEAAAIEAFEKYNARQEEAAKEGKPAEKKFDAARFGVPVQSTTMFMQSLQVAQQQYMQIMQALSAIIRQIQDMINTVIRNIHS